MKLLVASLAITAATLSFARIVTRMSRHYAPEYRYRPRVRADLLDDLRRRGGL